MKLLLISPKDCMRGQGIGWWNQEFMSLVRGKKLYSLARVSLPTIAALTPRRVEVRIIDENIDAITYDEDVDLVGIPCYTFSVARAYEIADEFRRRNVRVVLGGIHVSALPDEGLLHADSVVIGEAENVWERVIEDYENGRPQRIYRGTTYPSLRSLPLPRWDLMNYARYSTPTIQTSRGCPYDCEFCSINAFLGNKFRCKPVSTVIREVKNLVGLGFKLLFFTDDNFVGNRAYTVRLLKKLIPLRITYQTQITVSAAKDDELLRLLAESGCKRVVIGLESVSKESLKGMSRYKAAQAEHYAEYIRKIQSCGIEVYGSFILGNDCDDESVFEETALFVRDSGLALAAFSILTPYPGTRLFRRLESEGRLLHKDWAYYDSLTACFRPRRMSPETLQQGFYWIHQKVYSYEEIFARLRNMWGLWNTTNVRLWDRVSPLLINLNYNNVAYSYPLTPHVSVNRDHALPL